LSHSLRIGASLQVLETTVFVAAL